MARPYSMDLRERVVAAVEREGARGRGGGAIWRRAEPAIKWVSRYRQTGSVAPKPDGRSQAEVDPR